MGYKGEALKGQGREKGQKKKKKKKRKKGAEKVLKGGGGGTPDASSMTDISYTFSQKVLVLLQAALATGGVLGCAYFQCCCCLWTRTRDLHSLEYKLSKYAASAVLAWLVVSAVWAVLAPVSFSQSWQSFGRIVGDCLCAISHNSGEKCG